MSEGVKVGIVVYPLAFALNPDARFDDIIFFASIDYGLHANVAHVAFFEVVGSGQK